MLMYTLESAEDTVELSRTNLSPVLQPNTEAIIVTGIEEVANRPLGSWVHRAVRGDRYSPEAPPRAWNPNGLLGPPTHEKTALCPEVDLILYKVHLTGYQCK